MYPILFSFSELLTIHSYGFMLALGCLIAFYMALKDKDRPTILSSEQLSSCSTGLILSGITGGRLLFLCSEPITIHSWFDIIAIQDGGLSVLGAFISGGLFLFLFCKKENISLIKVSDLAAHYVPLVHFFGRIGCFLAGCCAGCTTTSWLGITYTNPECLAPLHMPLHPTQLYSAFFYLTLFIGLSLLTHKKQTPGRLITLYLAASSFERFFLDFLRCDRTFFSPTSSFLSINQWIAIGILIVAVYLHFFTKHKNYEHL